MIKRLHLNGFLTFEAIDGAGLKLPAYIMFKSTCSNNTLQIQNHCRYYTQLGYLLSSISSQLKIRQNIKVIIKVRIFHLFINLYGQK